MTVRTGGYVAFGPGDFVRTDRGITWGIKCTVMADSGVEFISIFSRNNDGTWNAEATIDDGFDLRTAEYPDVIDWFLNVLLPKLNAWLASKFPALTGGIAPPTPAALTRLEQADLLINTRLSITQNPDGTLTASLKP